MRHPCVTDGAGDDPLRASWGQNQIVNGNWRVLLLWVATVAICAALLHLALRY
jgi:hypothetical protein